MEVSNNEQSCALGAAMAGSVVGGVHKDFEIARLKMTGVNEKVYKPVKENQMIYDQLFKLYKQIHDGFGLEKNNKNMYNVMKDLLKIKDYVHNGDQI